MSGKADVALLAEPVVTANDCKSKRKRKRIEDHWRPAADVCRKK